MDRSAMFINSAKQAFAKSRCAAAMGHNRIRHLSVVEGGKLVGLISTGDLMAMEIIQADSQRHYHVQQMIIDTFERQSITLTPDELGEIWGMVEKHIELERKTVDFANEALATLKGTKMVVVQYLIEYLLEDENKHNKILDNLEGIKKGMYPYG